MNTGIPPHTAEQVFRNLERALFAAHEGSPDLAAIDRLYGSDFLSSNTDGKIVDKQGWLDLLKSGAFSVERITTNDFKVRRYGSTAVITGSSTYFKDRQSSWNIRHTQVWVEREGQWQLVSWQGTSTSTE